MSEPRKLYTGSASGGLDQEQYEAARRRAQQLAEQNARLADHPVGHVQLYP